MEKWLQEKGWQFDIRRQQSRTTFEGNVTKQISPIRLELYINERQRFFGVYAYVLFKIASTHHADLLEIIARANWGHEFAQFELNPDTGEFRCSSAIVLPNSNLSLEMIDAMAMCVLGWLDLLVGARF